MKRIILHNSLLVFLVVGMMLGLTHLIDTHFTFRIIFLILNILFGLVAGVVIRVYYLSSQIDQLTGISNRKNFYDKLNDELKRCKKANSILSLVLIDIDNFKMINDNFGHLNGDRVLKRLAQILKKNIRETDDVSRWGGEEFAIILPNTDAKSAKFLIERLQKIIATDTTIYNITISAGVADNNGEIGIDDFMISADRALYKAKETKNKVVSALD